MIETNWKYTTPVSIFLVAFYLVIVFQFKGLALMPGDVGDARLNNYFLENIYQFILGNVESLWHLSFFYPFPYVLGFSDNLFGSSPAYLLARFVGAPSDTAYQIWFLVGYLVNFTAAYYALRKLGGSVLAASIGSIIFAFALPTTAHAGHAQLHYRFGIPLAIVFLFEFLDKKSWRFLIISGAWLVWQFYAGIYMGFFVLLLMAAMTVSFLGYEKFKHARTINSTFYDFVIGWISLPKQKKRQYLLLLTILLALLVLLFFPYLQVSQLYGAKRSWGEISSMLPRPQSYFLSDASFLWSNSDSRFFAGITMRHEHQMFIGLAPLALALLGFFVGTRAKNGAAFTLMVGMLGLTVVLTLYIDGSSLWYFLHKLPLASAIRAMTRLDQAILFPIAYLSAIGIDFLRTRYVWGLKFVSVVILLFLLFETSMTSMGTSPKETWRQRISQADQLVPPDLPKDAIIFMAQRNGPWFADEIDAMWVAINRGVRTLNGYSGLFPPGYPGYRFEYGKDCTELLNRIVFYLNFSKATDPEGTYQEVISRVVPLGFENCDPKYLRVMPNISVVDRAYNADEIRNLSYQVTLIQDGTQFSCAIVKFINSSDSPFSARSKIGKPLRLSWRFLDDAGSPLSGWDTRKDLPFDIPAKGELEVRLPLNIPPNAVSLQVSMVQEAVFWAHDVGIEPVSISLRKL